jgi:SAM-dependent methyltransferase
MSEAPLDVVSAALADESALLEATFQGAQRGQTPAWRRVSVRPVLVRGERRTQFVFSDGVQDRTQNVGADEAAQLAAGLLAQPFGSILVKTTTETLRVQFSKKGIPLLHRERRKTGESIPLELAHDRHKDRILTEGDRIPFLRAIGVTTADGRVLAAQQRKFRQINEFLRLLDETLSGARLPERPLRVVDLGCGNAALTFATYHYLREIKGLPATMVGVDIKAPLMEKHRRIAADLGWDGLTFAAARIDDYVPHSSPGNGSGSLPGSGSGSMPGSSSGPLPDIVLALHACDTATDEALAQGVRWRSAVILSAPCCHHHLQAQLERAPVTAAARPLLRHGILKERFGDVLTDALRAHILRLLGYRADVIEFVPVEHTPKNLLIRAVRTDAPPDASLVGEYRQLKDSWSVQPYLETLLAAELEPVLAG